MLMRWQFLCLRRILEKEAFCHMPTVKPDQYRSYSNKTLLFRARGLIFAEKKAQTGGVLFLKNHMSRALTRIIEGCLYANMQQVLLEILSKWQNFNTQLRICILEIYKLVKIPIPTASGHKNLKYLRGRGEMVLISAQHKLRMLLWLCTHVIPEPWYNLILWRWHLEIGSLF